MTNQYQQALDDVRLKRAELRKLLISFRTLDTIETALQLLVGAPTQDMVERGAPVIALALKPYIPSMPIDRQSKSIAKAVLTAAFKE